MDCADAKLRMEPCASGALVPQELALFEEHIATCEGCRLELELVRAMGSNKADDWTLDRIFGSAVSMGSEVTAASPAASPAKTPAGASSESEPLPIAPPAAGNDEPAATTPAENAPSDAAMTFETTPNPHPPESDSTAFPDEPNPVSAISADIPPASFAAEPNRAPAPPAPSATPVAAVGVGNSWDFEPADAKPEASLPEGSLFFAEEALARRGDARKGQGAIKRIVIWGGGALVGVLLLALSLWIGLFAQTDGPDLRLGVSGANSTARQAPSGGEAPESLSSSATDSATDAAVTVAPEVVTQPADEVVADPRPAAGATTPGAAKSLGARALSGGGVPPVSPSTRSGSQPVAPRSTSGAPAATSRKVDPKKPTVTPAPNVAPKQAATSSANPPRPSADKASPAPDSRARASEELDPEQLILREPAPTPAPSEQSIPFAAGSKGGDSGQGAPPRNPASASQPTSGPSAAADPGSAAPPADVVQRPIDRLHLATVAAEQGSDLVSLRKIRDTWKGLVRTSVGPDRPRAKRELADCLWAIQSLTGRKSDKKVALATYREYLLNAPAGGADSRTVSRMRQLEDALAESK